MKLVIIDWVDSARTDEWVILPFKNKPVKCRSVGWLIEDKKKYKKLAPHMDTKCSQACGIMTIPSVAITRIREIPSSD